MTSVLEKSLPAEIKPVRALVESDMQLAEFNTVRYRVTPKSGVLPGDLLQPEYWSHVARKLSPLTEIRAICQDGSWMADYIVLNSGMNWAKVMKIGEWQLQDSSPTPTAAGYETEWAGPVHKHRVVRTVAGRKDILQHGFATDMAASAWLAEHLKALGR